MNGRIINLGAGQQGRTFAVTSATTATEDAVEGGRARNVEKNATASKTREETGPDRLTVAVRALDEALPLPSNARSFAYYTAALLIIVGGMMVQLLLSAKILQSEVTLAEKQYRHTIIERDNGEILWRIGRETNLRYVESRALKLGYVPIAEREYIDENGFIVSAESWQNAVANLSAPAETDAPTGDEQQALTTTPGEAVMTISPGLSSPQGSWASAATLAPGMVVEYVQQWFATLETERIRSLFSAAPAVNQSSSRDSAPSDPSNREAFGATTLDAITSSVAEFTDQRSWETPTFTWPPPWVERAAQNVQDWIVREPAQ